jgi:multidrug efflux system membrane fusion protein
VRGGALQGLAKREIPVQLVLGDGSLYPRPGKLIFADLAIDPATDTVAMRAVVPNPEHILLPGGYVQVRLEQAIDKAAILIPRDALLRNAGTGTATVMVVNADNMVEAVEVKAERLHGDDWLVSAGLRGGERVIVANVAKMQPGAAVKALQRTASPAAEAERRPPSRGS